MTKQTPTQTGRGWRIKARLIRALIRGWSDRDQGFEAMRRIGEAIAPDYRFRWPYIAWWRDREFNEILSRFDDHHLNADHRWTLAQLLRLVEMTPGDTAECGVYRGAGSFLICQANARSANPRVHHMFDSFEGLSTPTELDGRYWTEGDLCVGEEEVRGALAEFSEIEIHRGWIPERFGDVAGKKFSFVHVDVDLFEPTRDSIEFFYPRLNTGGILLCDDYGFTTCPGATRAVDEFLSDKPEAMIALADGGGFLIKGCLTAPGPPIPVDV